MQHRKAVSATFSNYVFTLCPRCAFVAGPPAARRVLELRPRPAAASVASGAPARPAGGFLPDVTKAAEQLGNCAKPGPSLEQRRAGQRETYGRQPHAVRTNVRRSGAVAALQADSSSE
jgi:hypothetical protein